MNGKLTSHERLAFQMFQSCLITAKALELTGRMQELTGRVHRGYQWWKTSLGLMQKVSDEVMKTLDSTQVRKILTNVNQSTIRMVPKATAHTADKDLWTMEQGQLSVLQDAAIEGKCLMCDMESWRSCPLRAVMKELPAELNGAGKVYCRCWDK